MESLAKTASPIPAALRRGAQQVALNRTEPLAPRHYKALSDLLRWTAHADLPDTNEFLSTHILSINNAVENNKEIELRLPATQSKSDHQSLIQQFCDVIATLYENAANKPPKVEQLSAHFSAIESVFEKALSLWHSDGAAAHYLVRPTSLLDGQSPLDVSRESPDSALRVISLLEKTRQSLEEIERDAETIRKQRPTPSIESVRNCALEFLHDEERANAFLHRPHPLLGDRIPIELAKESEEGAARVERLIRQAQANTAI